MIKARKTSAYSTELLDYFKADGYLRNGDVTKLYHRLTNKPANDYKGAYRFGSLFDYYYTETDYFKENIDYDGEKFYLSEGNKKLEFSFEEFELFVKSAQVLDAKYPNLRKYGVTQFIIKDKLIVNNREVKAKIKCDFWFDKTLPEMPKMKVIVDLKTTTATSKEEFMKRFFEYDYDRNGAFYLDVAKANVYMCLAISRNLEIYEIAVAKDLLQSGRAKYNYIIENSIKKGFLQA
jgi:hypothetical protein